MAAMKYADMTAESTVTSGMGDIELAGAIDADHSTFGSQFADGDEFPARVSGGGKWMTFRGRYNAGANSITRVNFRDSSTGAPISLSGTMTVICGWGAADAAAMLRADEAQSMPTVWKSQALDNLGASTLGKAIFAAADAEAVRVFACAAPIEALTSKLLNINPAAEISQENGASTVTLTATSTLRTKHIVDGWQIAYRGTFVAQAQQVTNAPIGFSNSVEVRVTTAQSSLGANDELSYLIPIKGARCRKLAFGTTGANALGIWFEINGVRPGTYSGAIRNADRTRSYPFTYSISSSNNWEHHTVMISGDQAGTWLRDANVGLYLDLCLAGGSSRLGTAGSWASADYSGATGSTNGVAATTDIFRVTGVGMLPLVAGVNLGDMPDAAHAPFITPHSEVALSDSQHYYWKTFAQGRNPAQATNDLSGAIQVRGPFPYPATKIVFPVPMCVAPAITFFNPKNANTNWYNQDTGTDSGPSGAQNVSEGGFVALIGGTVAGDTSWNGFNVHAVADSRLVGFS